MGGEPPRWSPSGEDRPRRLAWSSRLSPGPEASLQSPAQKPFSWYLLGAQQFPSGFSSLRVALPQAALTSLGRLVAPARTEDRHHDHGRQACPLRGSARVPSPSPESAAVPPTGRGAQSVPSKRSLVGTAERALWPSRARRRPSVRAVAGSAAPTAGHVTLKATSHLPQGVSCPGTSAGAVMSAEAVSRRRPEDEAADVRLRP